VFKYEKAAQSKLDFNVILVVLSKWTVICYSTKTFIIIYENINRNFSLVYSIGVVLAIGACIDLSPSFDLVDPSSFPDYRLFT